MYNCRSHLWPVVQTTVKCIKLFDSPISPVTTSSFSDEDIEARVSGLPKNT